jgi:spore maturation protein CgeB
MRFVLFYHSLTSDWNHGNAHFLRGMVAELQARGHEVTVYEPADGWSLRNLIQLKGACALSAFQKAYPSLHSSLYVLSALDVDAVLSNADVVIVHEWNPPELIARIAAHHERHSHYALLFHDTHHRSATDAASMAQYDLRSFDGVLAYGEVIRQLYLKHKWATAAWTMHEAADTRKFYPNHNGILEGDLVWIGNWGDAERAEELLEFLIRPVKELGLRAVVYGVRYPEEALEWLHDAGIEYRGWLPNYEVPEVFARFKVTVHVPRRPYARALPGIPTIRMFEALACGIPLVSAPWEDQEHLFTAGRDYLIARNGDEMKAALHQLIHDKPFAKSLAAHGLKTIQHRHTCRHRTDQLLKICASIRHGELANRASADYEGAAACRV